MVGDLVNYEHGDLVPRLPEDLNHLRMSQLLHVVLAHPDHPVVVLQARLVRRAALDYVLHHVRCCDVIMVIVR